MKKRLNIKRRVLMTGIMICIVVTLSMLYGYRNHNIRALLVSARENIFTRTVTSAELWSMPPQKLQDIYTFKTDQPRNTQALKALVSEHTELKVTASENTEPFAVLQVLLQNLHYAAPVSGCCSDYTETFIALALSQDYFAREVRKTDHVFAEIYIPAMKKWIWLDPQFALTAYTEDEEEPLSLFELRREVLSSVDVKFFNHQSNTKISLSNLPPAIAKFYKSDDFQEIKMLAGNNIWAEYKFNLKYSFLPKPLRQLLAYGADIKPVTLVYQEPSSLSP